MRRLLLPSFAATLLAACASTPTPAPTPSRPLAPEPAEHGELIGLTPDALGARFGTPDFQVREGSGAKLQWRGSCVLDAYLYPEGSQLRVVHVDTRSPQGSNVDQLTCLSALSAG